MVTKYFMHRMKSENGSFVKGIEIHDTVESAIQSFHAYMKQGYNNPGFPNVSFVSCMITDGTGSVVGGYNETWSRSEEYTNNAFFMHYIRENNGTFTKNIDVKDTQDAAVWDFHEQMAYGYNNSQYTNVSFVSCKITDLSGAILREETWNKTDEEPEE